MTHSSPSPLPASFSTGHTHSTRTPRPRLEHVLHHLTDRDHQLIHLLDEHQVFTTSQLRQLYFTSPQRAHARLLTLYRLHILDRFRVPLPYGSQEWRYTLGLLGARLAAAARGHDPPRPGAHADKIHRLARTPRLDHLLGANQFFTELAAHARHHPNTCALEDWLGEARAARALNHTARPDGIGHWHDTGHHGWFALEHDTGTEPLTRLHTKLAGYRSLAMAARPILVLFWLHSPTREANFHHLLHKRGSTSYLATASRTHATDLNASPAGPLWRTPGSEKRCRLADLHAPTPGQRDPR